MMNFFFKFRELCIRNWFNLVRVSKGYFTETFWDVWENFRLYHHGNTSSYISFIMRNFMIENMTTVSHPSYPPDLAPCNFYLFSKMKFRLKRSHFNTIEEIQGKSQQVADTLQATNFKSASKNGKVAGIIVYKPKKTTLKVTVEFMIYVFSFYSRNYWKFWVVPSIFNLTRRS